MSCGIKHCQDCEKIENCTKLGTATDENNKCECEYCNGSKEQTLDVYGLWEHCAYLSGTGRSDAYVAYIITEWANNWDEETKRSFITCRFC
jgi:hypothetical protein